MRDVVVSVFLASICGALLTLLVFMLFYALRRSKPSWSTVSWSTVIGLVGTGASIVVLMLLTWQAFFESLSTTSIPTPGIIPTKGEVEKITPQVTLTIQPAATLTATITPVPGSEVSPQPPNPPLQTPTFEEILSDVCSGVKPFSLNGNLPTSDPCGERLDLDFVPGVWIVTLHSADLGFGKCLYHYSSGDLEKVNTMLRNLANSSMWVLGVDDVNSRELPQCPVVEFTSDP